MGTDTQNVDHGARKHALLSASGASRWMACTPSPRLEENFENTTSPYAEEGTLAHEFAEMNLKLELGILSKKEYDKLTKPLLKNLHYSDDMEEEVQKHIDYVIQQFYEAKRRTPDAKLLIEERVDLTYYIEDGFGTNDIIIIADGVLEVIDLKYGKGVRVSAKDNSQLKLYGLGALRAYELMYDIHTVRLSITQPRLDSISSWEIDADELRVWGEEVVKPKAQQAYAGEGEQVPGDHCRFCRAKAKCKALANLNLEVAKKEFTDPMLLTDAELLEMHKIGPQIIDWLNGVADYIFKEALNGKKWPDFKLVEGRSNRVWLDADKVKQTLLDNGFEASQILSEPKLLGIGAIEKVVGRKNFDPLLNEFVDKPKGKPTLVPEADKRPEYSNDSAYDDFNAVTD